MIFNARQDEQWRVDRLKKALSNFCEIYGISEPQAEQLIESLTDQKGRLVVCWREVCYPPTPDQVLSFGKAWGFCKESSSDVEHVTVDVI